VTAAFNRNVLAVLNRELGGDLVPERFVHRAVWDPVAEWIEMRLRSTARQVARLDRLGLEVAFEEGEEILTETSAKFRPAGVVAELATAGLREEVAWSDPVGDFRLGLSRRGSHAA
jgi:L-histidine N-alpha-methyltransferase